MEAICLEPLFPAGGAPAGATKGWCRGVSGGVLQGGESWDGKATGAGGGREPQPARSCGERQPERLWAAPAALTVTKPSGEETYHILSPVYHLVFEGTYHMIHQN